MHHDVHQQTPHHRRDIACTRQRTNSSNTRSHRPRHQEVGTLHPLSPPPPPPLPNSLISPTTTELPPRARPRFSPPLRAPSEPGYPLSVRGRPPRSMHPHLRARHHISRRLQRLSSDRVGELQRRPATAFPLPFPMHVKTMDCPEWPGT
jgi:hypothetical protein